MTRLAVAVALLILSVPAGAQEPPMSELEESLGRRKIAPVIPAELRPMVREATRDRLVVRSLAGADIAIDIGEMEPESFAQYAGGRYFGFSFIGYEFFGYILVDRAMQGDDAVIATGAAPAFSPDGRYFAAVQFSGADAGNMEGFALWEVTPEGSRQRLFNAAFPPGTDWRIDGWPREDCVTLSAAANGEPPQPRSHYALKVGEGLVLNPDEDSTCDTMNAAVPGND